MRAMDESAIRILLCRPGFEAECAAEAGDGEVRGAGIVSVTAPAAWPDLKELVFARQAFRQAAELTALPAGDRINPILAALAPHAGPVNALLLEHPDSEAGKELAGFLRKFTPALTSALAKQGLKVERGAPRR